jgi:hypothetical protein
MQKRREVVLVIFVTEECLGGLGELELSSPFI